MKFRTLTLIAAMTLLAMMSLSAQSFAKSTITTFNAPGAGANNQQGTAALSMNEVGAITGVTIDSHGFIHGIVRDPNGTVTIFDVKGAVETVGYSINDKGEITGFYTDQSGTQHGFKRDVDGDTTTIDVPNAEGTNGVSINNDGTIAGNYLNQQDEEQGFVRDSNANYTTFGAPGARGTEVVPNGMNANGATTGYKLYGQSTGQAWLRSPDGTDFPTFDVYGARSTYAYGINADATVVGYSEDLSDVYHGYYRLQDDGTIVQFNDPNAGVAPGQGTQAYAINKTLWITGAFADPKNGIHGFVRSPKSVFTNFNIPGAISLSRVHQLGGRDCRLLAG
jgi:hypothetical protein